ncbi:MAG: N-acetylmuramoyl-L-alanine amidase [Alphaproteobacteria bacterium]|nr:N-acetylmuramoyl-L-alanine amidase [Alphaproteobacteria bacterium]
MEQALLGRRLLLGHGLAASFLVPTSWSRAAMPPAARGPAHAPGRPGQGRAPVRPVPVPPLVVLDPGHGGKDPGAIGISGTHEKEVALAAAFDLRRDLEGSGRYRVEMTRASDVFIPLERRVDYAQSRGAALLVSMHADAIGDHGVRGASIYTLAATASDPQTARLAERENNADRFADPRFRALPPTVVQILASLVQRETRVGSVRLARDLVDQLDRDLPMLPNPARHAGFVVLKAADIPSVLVEMGFMSNREDEAALRRPEHRARVAAAMRRAVDAYFAANDHMTRMAG